MSKALDDGCKHVITCGSAQSNHCRATAVVCAELGLQCHLFLRSQHSVSVNKDRCLVGIRALLLRTCTSERGRSWLCRQSVFQSTCGRSYVPHSQEVAVRGRHSAAHGRAAAQDNVSVLSYTAVTPFHKCTDVES